MLKKNPVKFQNFYCGGPADTGGMIKKVYNKTEKWALAKIYGLFMGRMARKKCMVLRDQKRKAHKALHNKTDVDDLLTKIKTINALSALTGGLG